MISLQTTQILRTAVLTNPTQTFNIWKQFKVLATLSSAVFQRHSQWCAIRKTCSKQARSQKGGNGDNSKRLHQTFLG